MASKRFGLRDRRSSKTTSQSPSAFFTHSWVCGVIKCDSLFHDLNKKPVVFSHLALDLGSRADNQIHGKMNVGGKTNFGGNSRRRTAVAHYNQEVDIRISRWIATSVRTEKNNFLRLRYLYRMVHKGKNFSWLNHWRYHTTGGGNLNSPRIWF